MHQPYSPACIVRVLPHKAAAHPEMMPPTGHVGLMEQPSPEHDAVEPAPGGKGGRGGDGGGRGCQ